MSTIFKKIIDKEIPCYKVAEDEQFLAFLDINPNSKGHTLCIPKIETDDILDLDKETYKNLMLFSRKVAKSIKDVIQCKKISINFINEKDECLAKINPQLFGWCIENIIKNSVDAIKDKGKIIIRIEKNNSIINIYLEDNGVGMEKSSFVKIFNPGFTTKERGWGLGLSLSKRIIEDYHSGEIKVLKSELNVGTTFLITLNGRK